MSKSPAKSPLANPEAAAIVLAVGFIGGLGFWASGWLWVGSLWFLWNVLR